MLAHAFQRPLTSFIRQPTQSSHRPAMPASDRVRSSGAGMPSGVSSGASEMEKSHGDCPCPARERRKPSVVFQRWSKPRCPVQEREPPGFQTTPETIRVSGAHTNDRTGRHLAAGPKPKHSSAVIARHSSAQRSAAAGIATIARSVSIRDMSIAHRVTGRTNAAA